MGMIAFGQVPADCRVGGRHEISKAFAAAIAQSETVRAGETRIVLRITQGSQVQILSALDTARAGHCPRWGASAE